MPNDNSRSVMLKHSRACKLVLALATLALLLDLAGAEAQTNLRGPRLGYVYPAGGQQGATIRVNVGGQFLDGTSSALFSGDGIQAAIIEHTKPITQKQYTALRDELQQLTERRTGALGKGRRKADASDAKNTKTPWTDADQKRFEEIRHKLATAVRKPANPAIAETITLDVTLSPDAAPGMRDLRLSTAQGLTNPLVFCVGPLPECREEAEKPPAAKGRKQAKNQGPVAGPGPETRVALPAVINGQILPGDVDRFRFSARKGQRLVAATAARSLIPYLADAVPGWFQATLALYDSTGRELAYADDYRFQPDPILFCEIPADGEYLLEIKDAIYRGREDFVYRVTVGELPWITSIFPLGASAGRAARTALAGWNLPQAELSLDDLKAPGVRWLSVGGKDGPSNAVPFEVDTLPERLEQDLAGQAGIPLPVIVNGRIDRPEQVDAFRFQGRQGDQIVAEVTARRLDSPLDSLLRLTDASGKQLAANDDHEDPGAGLHTHHADSWLRATLPADGVYTIHLADAQHRGAPEYAYRLRISRPMPDFQLRVVPSSINARAGASQPITVYALRRDGFDGEIALGLKDPPPGFALSGAVVPAGQNQVRLTLTAGSPSDKTPIALVMEGRAAIHDREVVRPVVPAEDQEQAFAYHHLVPVHQWLVSVAGRSLFKSPPVIADAPVRIPLGGSSSVKIRLPGKGAAARMTVQLSDPSEGITIRDASPSPDGLKIQFQADATKIKPGTKGNLILLASAKTADSAKGKKGTVRKGASYPLPAIPYEIVPAHRD